MSIDDKKRYLGDGLYASYDGEYIWLSCERDGGEHRVALDASTLAEFERYIAFLRGLRDPAPGF